MKYEFKSNTPETEWEIKTPNSDGTLILDVDGREWALFTGQTFHVAQGRAHWWTALRTAVDMLDRNKTA